MLDGLSGNGGNTGFQGLLCREIGICREKPCLCGFTAPETLLNSEKWLLDPLPDTAILFSGEQGRAEPGTSDPGTGFCP